MWKRVRAMPGGEAVTARSWAPVEEVNQERAQVTFCAALKADHPADRLLGSGLTRCLRLSGRNRKAYFCTALKDTCAYQKASRTVHTPAASSNSIACNMD